MNRSGKNHQGVGKRWNTGVIGSDVPWLARLSGLQGFNMGHNSHGISMHGVIMTLMGINMYADNLAEDIWTRYTGPKHVSNQKLHDVFKGILGLQLATQTPRYSQCAKPASFAAVIYHPYAKFHMLSNMSEIYILFVFHTHINWHLHWLFIDITDIQCWWVVFYMSKTLCCIFWLKQ